MKSPLLPIEIISIYKNELGDRKLLPGRMAKCTPDTYQAILNTAKALEKVGGKLVLSDLFRSYDMQAQSHKDYASGKKNAFSPPPGGSFHEAGRAFDLDLGAMKISLKDFWVIAKANGLYPIIEKADKNLSEAWHFDCRGSHQLVYDYYQSGKGKNFKPYTAAAASAILSVNIRVDAFGEHQREAAIQSCLIRLGNDIGNLDGLLGMRSLKALDQMGIPYSADSIDAILTQLEHLIQQAFNKEFSLT